jgi:CheY-like chemotaxis protein
MKSIEMESILPDGPAPRHAAILLVEDESDIRDLMASYLCELGYHVLAAADSGEALAHIEGHADFELLLTDVVLPGGMSGFALAERALRHRPELKVIYVSGHLRDEDVERWQGLPRALLHKPFRLRQLRAEVEQVLLG